MKNDPLAGRPGLRTEPAKGNKLARELGELAKRHSLLGCVLISFKFERYGVNSSGEHGMGPAMEKLGNAILADIDDGKYDPE